MSDVEVAHAPIIDEKPRKVRDFRLLFPTQRNSVAWLFAKASNFQVLNSYLQFGDKGTN